MEWPGHEHNPRRTGGPSHGRLVTCTKSKPSELLGQSSPEYGLREPSEFLSTH